MFVLMLVNSIILVLGPAFAIVYMLHTLGVPSYAQSADCAVSLAETMLCNYSPSLCWLLSQRGP